MLSICILPMPVTILAYMGEECFNDDACINIAFASCDGTNCVCDVGYQDEGTGSNC